MEARGAIETAHRVKDACGQVFRYGVAIGALLRDVMAHERHPVTRAALKPSALLLLRPDELRHMGWARLGLDAALLTVPPEVMKRKKADKAGGPPHLVPLARRP